eukprot:1149277-Pelagomonas_calceolata.AAC.3
MSEKKNGSIVGPAIGLTAASLLAAQNADAATELADVAAIDNRVALLASLFVPVLGWVAFNILPGLFRQLEYTHCFVMLPDECCLIWLKDPSSGLISSVSSLPVQVVVNQGFEFGTVCAISEGSP